MSSPLFRYHKDTVGRCAIPRRCGLEFGLVDCRRSIILVVMNRGFALLLVALALVVLCSGQTPGANAASSAENNWQEHWAFQPLEKPDVPRVDDAGWCRTAVDRFVLSELAAAGLGPSAAADRRTWIRRATFNLRGLPPTPEEVSRFLEDRSPDAFPHVVNRLLSEPQYGERWARYWLDVARYADTKGGSIFVKRDYPFAYTYRDYVIEALNDDKPFDRFVREQIAADRLHAIGEADARSLRAMGFLTVGMHFMGDPHNVIDDRIDVVTRGFLGLTVACARCHDHKSDPIPIGDYYSLYGVFASTAEPSILPLYEQPPPTEEYQSFEKEFEARVKKMEEYIGKKYTEVVEGARTRIAEYLLAAHDAETRPSTQGFMFVASPGDPNPYVIIRWQAHLRHALETEDPVFAAWHAFAELPEDDFATRAKEIVGRFGGRSDRPLKVHPHVARAFIENPPSSLAEVAQTYEKVMLAAQTPEGSSLIVMWGLLDAVNYEALRRSLYGRGSPADLPPPGVAGLSALWLLPDRQAQGEYSAVLGPVEDWQESGPGAPPRAMGVVNAAVSVEPFIFLRGNPSTPGERVPRQFLGALSGERREPFREGSGRLELARAIGDAENPLTARVIVNRVWMHHFGEPLVRTPADFGLRSDPPSHPQLLDWLASSFIESGWSIKWLHREILLSAAYRQRSDHRADAAVVDPENRLLWKMNRVRLDFEATRDSLLAVAGALDGRVGGPSAEVLEKRRSVYTRVNRHELPGLLRTFDFPSPDALSPQRAETTVAPQALFLMNHPFIVECASRLLALPEVAGAETEDARIDRLYALLFQRAPEADERAWGRTFLSPSALPRPLYLDWKFGYGKLDSAGGRLESFTEFPHWSGSSWQTAEKRPLLDSGGGLASVEPDAAVVRRWSSRFDGRIEVSGLLRHEGKKDDKGKPEGDGVRGVLLSSRQGLIGEWDAHAGTAPNDAQLLDVHKDETLDFVVVGKDDASDDRFEWTVTILEKTAGSAAHNPPGEWHSQRDFRGPQADAAVQYVQALLLLNEFVFPD